MKIASVVEQIQIKKSFLCIGLDTDKDKIPSHLLSEEDPIFAFNKQIIDATQHLAVAIKINTAFYEAYGVQGWVSLEKTIRYIKEHYPDIFTIADAKRGDIGNTSLRYAKAFYEALPFDSITVAPYMGEDSVAPFLSVEDKHTILLALTSNKGAFDFQTQKIAGKELYKTVIETASSWEHSDRMMYVVGATKAAFLSEIRSLIPNSFLLVPGVGAQGGSLEEVYRHGSNDQVGLLVNSSRGIIYASDQKDFASAALDVAQKIQNQMAKLLTC
jgi:orotidine-5'-phosphate decarboxylase